MLSFFTKLFSVLCVIIAVQHSCICAQRNPDLQQPVKLAAGKYMVVEVLSSLQQQSNYRYLYDPAQVQSLSINIPRGPLSLSAILQLLDQQLPLEIEIKDNIIAIRNEPHHSIEKNATGMLQGRVFNDQNEPIPGVTVSVSKGPNATTTRVDGSYILQLQEGSYNVQFSHLSFASTTVNNIIIKSGKTVVKDIMLSGTSSSLKSVTITGSAKGGKVATLYNRQKNAAAFTDGISSEQIVRTPDKDVGEVLKRISGVATIDNKYIVVRGMSERYNAAMLNGQIMPSTELNRKNFSFDIIPSNIIDNITVYKTITPDMSAEFGGGLVNVDTKTIPTENFFTITAGGSVNNQTTGKPFYSLKLGSEYFGRPSDHRNLFGKLGWKDLKSVLANTGSYTGNVQAGDYPVKNTAAFANNWGIYKMIGHPSQNYQLSWGHVLNLEKNRQLGLIAAASYRNTLLTQRVESERDGFQNVPGKATGDDSLIFRGRQYGFSTNIGLLAGIGYTAGQHKLSLQTLYINSLDQQFILGKGLSTYLTTRSGNAAEAMGYYDNVQWTRLSQTQLKGVHHIGEKGARFQWMGTYTYLDRQRPDNHHLNAVAPEDAVTTDPVLMQGPPGARGTNGALRWWTRAYEFSFNWDASIQVPFKFNIGKKPLTSIFKTGYAGWYKDRSFYVARAGVKGPDSDVPRPVQWFFDNKSPDYSLTFDVFGDDFHRNASLRAVYGMLDHKLAGKLRLIWGVRAEYYNLNKVNQLLDSLIAKTGQRDAYDYSALYNREKNWKIFPSASLIYNLTQKMNLRASYAESVIRPDMREMAYFKEYDFELGREYTSSSPLVSSRLKHLDFRYEYYPGPGEILSFSLFYKNIHDPMEIMEDFQGFSYQLRNNYTAENKGIEIEVRKSLSFIHVPVIKNLTLYANGTRLFARVRKTSNMTYTVDPPGSNRLVLVQQIGNWEDRPQQGASNYMFNGGIYYDTRLVSVSLLYNYVSNRMFIPNQNAYLSLYEKPIESLDGQVAIRLLKEKMVFRANVSNLLNSYSLVYTNQGDGDPYSGEKRTAAQLMYQKGKDLVSHRVTPGRTYSFTVSYNF